MEANKDFVARMTSWKVGRLDVQRAAAARRIQSFYRKHLQRCKAARLGSKKFKVTNDTLALTSALLLTATAPMNTLHAREKHLVLPIEDVPHTAKQVDALVAVSLNPPSLSSTLQEILILGENPYEVEAKELRDRLVHGAFVNMMSESWLLCSTEERLSVHLPHNPKPHIPFYSRFLGFDVKPFLSDVVFVSRGGPFHPHITKMNSGSSSASHLRKILEHVTSLNPVNNWYASTQELAAKVGKIFWVMRSEMMMPAIRSLGWILSKVWRVLFEGVFIDQASIAVIEELVASLGPNVGLVLTPTHKSHLDYLLVSYVCFAYGLPLPRIAAGNNLNLPLVGSYLRSNGSFFIRRSYQGDTLYKEVLTSYVHQVLADGAPLEVFVEGGRSRHGRVMKPKFGFFNMVTSFLASHPEKDVLVVPISLDYDRVLEVPEYSAQLLGKPKQKESILSLLKSIWELFFPRCGNVYLRIGKPLPMQHHLEHFGLDALASTVALGMQSAATVTSTAIVSALLLWKRRDVNLTLESLVDDASWLVPHLQHLGAVVAPFDSTRELVVHALTVLQMQLDPTTLTYRVPVSSTCRVLEMTFYRNHLLHLMISQATLSVVVSSRLEHGASLHISDIAADAARLWTYCSHLCPHPHVVDWKTHLVEWVSTLPFVHVHLPDRLAIESNRWHASNEISFLNMLLWPFVDALVLVLAVMDTSETLAETELFARVRRLPTDYSEAYSTETLKHAMAALVDLGAVTKEDRAHFKRRKEFASVAACLRQLQAPRAKIWQAKGARVHQPIQVSSGVRWLFATHGLIKK
ncbi:hypothetical protein AeRB84_010598 [Aphanomyces euteiches]|nr:hypothetical protein AeRB84_010598 [Aphanomyces euteiches]